MKKIIFVAGVLSIGILFFTSAAGAAAIKEGQWSMTTVIRMEGMDDKAAEAMKEMENMSPEEKAMMESMMGGMGMKMGVQGGGISTTMTQCITNDDPVPEADNKENCKQTHTVKGNTVNFEVVCDNSRSTGSVTYKNDSMQGTIQSTQVEKGQEKKVTLDISGEYVGPCTEAAVRDLSKKELVIREKELELKNKELTIKEKELELRAADKKEKNSKAALQDVNSAVNTTNNVKNTFSGLKSLLGR
ncbi:MAG: hypothetical protein A2787_05800 [Omnitrophica WOR_2 bacterium RIFCSPHIGHO2_01_FULL_48_9]|nr:MAG: hypothetical protein A2787_05800 [Omnitrophica WOR_2 bacterium RIFCSPHIGHO2_01_FULL_48_9]